MCKQLITLNFDNTLTLPVKNYKVKLYVTFNNHAVERYNDKDAVAVDVNR